MADRLLDLSTIGQADPYTTALTANRAIGLADMMRASAPASEDWTTEAPPEMPAADLRPPARATATPKPPSIEDLFRQGNVRVEKGPEALDLSQPLRGETAEGGKFYGGASTAPSPEFGREQSLADLQMIAQELASRGDYQGAQNWMAQAAQMQQQVMADQQMRAQREREERLGRTLGQATGTPGSPHVTTTIDAKGNTSYRVAPPPEAVGGRSSFQQDAMREADRLGLTGDAKRDFVLKKVEEYQRRIGQAGGFGTATGTGLGRQQVEMGPPGTTPQLPGTTPGGTVPTVQTPPDVPPEVAKTWAGTRAFLAARGAKVGGMASAETQQILGGMANAVRLIEDLEKNPNIDKYGYKGRRAWEGVKDVAAGFGVGSPNPDFIDFRQNIRQQALSAFDYGGKQLTQTEKDFVLAAIPSGQENTPYEIRRKLTDMRNRLVYIAEVRSRLAGTPVANLEGIIGQELLRYRGTPSGGAAPQTRGAELLSDEELLRQLGVR